ncbi:type III PLP-dependent enzyme [Nitrosomonas europaea]|uniref:type III PLP-dependent enzyme n=1 Tax=Nitrosomonas europaea TaxID=915 RepID=UPI0007972D05|nr:type III PLP-dependent enzyme [Nitrosomonas europaea]KXK41474.1 MAG: Orn/DAP/Arg decarboxylase family protein [Nitrosomonas europaea]HRN81123.1 type III PLP-dependent enzyme [Nitrosomonas europaea]HRO55314.1 type III PLP-dependent enzyme [Nitrosomonas europaea]HRQ07761.1 type III PLP-dependent enzyme [Nitrosomonas europaea]HUM72976.1 type III PLP-dependent enzyme [Nitrosomonas europaea]
MKKSFAAVQQQTETSIVFDTHPEVSIDLSLVEARLKQGYQKPFLLIDSNIIRSKARRFKTSMPRVRPHYAAKANPDPRVLKTLIEEGVGFEIASIAELDLLMSLGVPAAEIFYSNPMKSRAYIEYAAAKGVEWYVLDSIEELRKIVSIKPDAKLYLRIDTPNIGSDWPLAGKFGTHLVDVSEIIDEAVRLKADLAGVTFHVGSQCRNPQNWRVGIERAQTVFASMREAGLKPRLLNLGGGYPVRHVKPIPSIEVIAEVINEAIADLPEDIHVMAEPGRYLVSDSACFVCRVVGTATRNGKRWMYWDAGIFGGIIEVSEGLRYEILTQRNGSLIPWSVAGPTCDSVDVLMHDEMLPEDIQENDFIFIPNAGAYTTSYASNFNGFPLPDVVVI